MKNKQTAVEWLEEKFKLYRNEKLTDWDLIFEDAKRMEKKQMKIKSDVEDEQKRKREFSKWFRNAFEISINSTDKHAEDWN